MLVINKVSSQHAKVVNYYPNPRHKNFFETIDISYLLNTHTICIKFSLWKRWKKNCLPQKNLILIQNLYLDKSIYYIQILDINGHNFDR